MDNVAIVGVAQTRYEKGKTKNFAELVYEVTRMALDDAGLELDDIDNVVTTTNDFYDGRTIACMAIAEAAGSYGRDATNVEGDGTLSAFYGLMRTLSGVYGTTLVTTHCKVSEGSPRKIFNQMFDPIYDRPLGMDAISSSALQARAYMDRYGITQEQCAKVSVKNHGNARNNPYAHVPLEITVEDVMKSPVLADPIKRLDVSPISDGACAIILASEDRVKNVKKPVWIKGVAHCADAYRLGERDLSRAGALEEAAKKAYAMAGIRDPFREIDVAEVYDAFSYMELMWYEGLGFCGAGEGGRLMDSGETGMAGSLPVNPSGGVLSAHSVQVAGLARIAECVLQLRGEAGQRQVPGAKLALAHGITGICAQTHCVWVLSNSPAREVQ